MTRSLILLSAIAFFAGCDSGSGSQDTDAGTATPVVVSITGDQNPCFSKPECAPVVTYPGGSYYPTVTIPCGWDKATNTCYVSWWCEPSVASKNPNQYDATETKNLRPESAMCSAGTATYTYPANGLLMWGEGNFGSQYTSTVKTPASVPKMYGVGDTIDVVAHICKLYPEANLKISC